MKIREILRESIPPHAPKGKEWDNLPDWKKEWYRNWKGGLCKHPQPYHNPNWLGEGGWDSTVTQGTVITPQVVRAALGATQQFVNDFNSWLDTKNLGPVQMGRPTGSSAHHAADAQDKPDNVYGDVDLQMIAPPVEGASYNQYTSYWNDLANEFVKTQRPAYVHPGESKVGHPIVAVGKDQFVQVDFMWHEPTMAKWGAARVTPERGVKGSLHGNMFSVLGEILDMSIQHAGVQLKVIDDKHVSFSKQKGTQTITVSTNPDMFIRDIFNYEYEKITGKPVNERIKVDPLLARFSGANLDDPKIAGLVNGVKGLARTFELYRLYGQGDLAQFASAQDFLARFQARYEEKAMIDLAGKKRDKAETPDAKARAEKDKEKILNGLQMVKGLFV